MEIIIPVSSPRQKDLLKESKLVMYAFGAILQKCKETVLKE